MKITNQEKIYTACANITRLMIIKMLKQYQYASVTSISTSVNMSVKSISKHLQIILSAGIIEYEKNGTTVYYKIKKPMNPIVKNIVSNL